MLKYGVSFPLGQPEIKLPRRPSCKSEEGGWVMQHPPPPTFHQHQIQQQIHALQNSLAGCQGTREEESPCVCQGFTSFVGSRALAPAVEPLFHHIHEWPWGCAHFHSCALLRAHWSTGINFSSRVDPRAFKSSNMKNSKQSWAARCRNMTACQEWAATEHLWLLNRLIFLQSWHCTCTCSVNMKELSTLSTLCANLGAGDLFEAAEQT